MLFRSRFSGNPMDRNSMVGEPSIKIGFYHWQTKGHQTGHYQSILPMAEPLGRPSGLSVQTPPLVSAPPNSLQVQGLVDEDEMWKEEDFTAPSFVMWTDPRTKSQRRRDNQKKNQAFLRSDKGHLPVFVPPTASVVGSSNSFQALNNEEEFPSLPSPRSPGSPIMPPKRQPVPAATRTSPQVKGISNSFQAPDSSKELPSLPSSSSPATKTLMPPKIESVPATAQTTNQVSISKGFQAPEGEEETPALPPPSSPSKQTCPACGKEVGQLMSHLRSKKCREILGEARIQELREEAARESVKKKAQKYNQSDKGKSRKQKYDVSDKGKEVKQTYNQSDKGKEVKQTYNQSDKGKEVKIGRAHV